jgi:hypothetical protein
LCATNHSTLPAAHLTKKEEKKRKREKHSKTKEKPFLVLDLQTRHAREKIDPQRHQ